MLFYDDRAVGRGELPSEVDTHWHGGSRNLSTHIDVGNFNLSTSILLLFFQIFVKDHCYIQKVGLIIHCEIFNQYKFCLYMIICKSITLNISNLSLTLTVLNFWKFTSYCSLKPLWSGMGEVVPACTSPTLHPPSPPAVHQLSWLAL